MKLTLWVPKTIEECQSVPIRLDEEDEEENDPPAAVEFRLNMDDDLSNDNVFNRTNSLWKSLVETEKFSNKISLIESLTLTSFWLDDCNLFFDTLKDYSAPLNTLALDECRLSQRAAQTLGNILASSSFEVKKLELKFLMGSTEWIYGLLENKTVTQLCVAGANAFVFDNVIHFIYHSSRLEKVELVFTPLSSRRNSSEAVLNRQQQQKKTEISLKEFEISMLYPLSLSICQGIGRILREAKHLKKFQLCDLRNPQQRREDRPVLPHDFTKDIIHCNELIFYKYNFDPHTIASLMQRSQQDGDKNKNLLNLTIAHIPETPQTAALYNIVDISLLESFVINIVEPNGSHIIKTSNSFLLNGLCRYFARGGRGPRITLGLFIDTDLNEFAFHFASSLLENNDTNTEIQTKGIHLHAKSIAQQDDKNDLGLQLLLVDGMPRKMPNLNIWNIQTTLPPPINPRRNQQIQNWIVQQLEQSWSIKDITIGLLNDDFGSQQKVIDTMIRQNKLLNWPRLLRDNYKMSSGIWSFALSRQNHCNVGRLFRIIRQIPGLFQQVANQAAEAEANQKEGNRVPHHPNCPGCHKRQRKK